MKTRLLSLLCCFIALSGSAQSFAKSQKDLNIGFGFGNHYAGRGYNSSYPAITLALDYGITDEISLGGMIGFGGATYQYFYYDVCNNGNVAGNFSDTYRWSFTLLGFRGAYHFDKLIKVPQLDAYAGLMLYDAFGRYSFTSTNPCRTKGLYSSNAYGGVYFAGFIGARYRFTDHFGVFLELGYGLSAANFGLNYKF
ncbi:MAG TPA: hypothetical protein VI112_00825 [Bacteroidia bacterium]|jgi:hypothetical protein